MKRRPDSVRLSIALLVTLMLAGAGRLQAQIPDTFENLQVLPRDIDRRQLMGTMRSFATGLGVRCEFCHVGEAGAPLDTFDFASDEKSHKEKARLMMKMVRDINQNHIAPINQAGAVRCVTCHHGLPRPQMLEDVLASAHAESGVEAAVAKYRELREQYYGGFQFDFGERTLLMFATRLAQQKQRPGDALEIVKLNAEFFPRSADTQFFLARLYMMQQENQSALRHARKALQLNPDHRQAKGLVNRLKRQQD